MNIQEIFDKVIVSGIYTPVWQEGYDLMCFALHHSKVYGTITQEEYEFAKSEIREYLGPFGSLGGFLNYKDQPCDFAARLAIYKDWENRPKFK